MSINFWRYVNYSDDGCSIYQCLMCYNKWDARTEPGWYDVDNTYHPTFIYCPFCGTKWIGKHGGGRSRDDEYYNEKNYGPRKYKIAKALQNAWNRPIKKNKKFWIIESKLCRNYSSYPDTWGHHHQYDMETYSAKDMKEIVESLRKDEEQNLAFSKQENITFYSWDEYRIRVRNV
jgi:hypothetical protein